MYSHRVKPKYLIQANTQDQTEQKLLEAAAKLLESKEKLVVTDQKETQTMSLHDIFSKALKEGQTVSLSSTPGLFLDLDKELADKAEDAKSNKATKVCAGKSEENKATNATLAQQWRATDDACGCTMQMQALNDTNHLGQVYMLNTRNSKYQMDALNKKNWTHLKMVELTDKLLEVLPTIPVSGLNEERPRRFLAVYKPENGVMTPYVFNVPNKMSGELAKAFMADVQQALMPQRSPSPTLA